MASDDDLAELRREVAELRARLDDFDATWHSHIGDALAVTHVVSAQQRRQELIGRATIAISRAMLDPADGIPTSLSQVIAHLEAELDRPIVLRDE